MMICLSKMVIFHSYVKEPKGIICFSFHVMWFSTKMDEISKNEWFMLVYRNYSRNDQVWRVRFVS